MLLLQIKNTFISRYEATLLHESYCYKHLIKIALSYEAALLYQSYCYRHLVKTAFLYLGKQPYCMNPIITDIRLGTLSHIAMKQLYYKNPFVTDISLRMLSYVAMT